MEDENTIRRLSAAQWKQMNDVRKSLWIGGLQGLVLGSVTGGLASVVHQNRLRTVDPIAGRNKFMAGVMIGGAVGSFFGATVFGKSAFNMVSSLFDYSTDYARVMRANEADASHSEDESYIRRKQAIDSYLVKQSNSSVSENRNFPRNN